METSLNRAAGEGGLAGYGGGAAVERLQSQSPLRQPELGEHQAVPARLGKQVAQELAVRGQQNAVCQHLPVRENHFQVGGGVGLLNGPA